MKRRVHVFSAMCVQREMIHTKKNQKNLKNILLVTAYGNILCLRSKGNILLLQPSTHPNTHTHAWFISIKAATCRLTGLYCAEVCS